MARHELKARTKGKRTHVPRGTLTAEAIVDAAFQIVADSGLESLSMPNLARNMGVGVTSIYWYFASKDDLLEAVAQQATAYLTLDDQASVAGGWEELLAEHFLRIHHLLLQHPGLGDLVLNRGLPAPASLGHDQRSTTTHARVKSMIDSGMSRQTAIQGYLTVALYTFGYSSWASAEQKTVPGRPRRRSVMAGPGDPYTIHPSEGSFEFGLQLILAGLRQQTSARRH